MKKRAEITAKKALRPSEKGRTFEQKKPQRKKTKKRKIIYSSEKKITPIPQKALPDEQRALKRQRANEKRKIRRAKARELARERAQMSQELEDPFEQKFEIVSIGMFDNFSIGRIIGGFTSEREIENYQGDPVEDLQRYMLKIFLASYKRHFEKCI